MNPLFSLEMCVLNPGTLRKYLGIFLFVCLLAPSAGTYIWLQYEKKMTKKEVKRMMISGIDKKELVFFKFSKEDTKKLDWKHSKEFKYNEQMYDVVESEIKGDSIAYWCWWDNEETKLNAQLKSLVEKDFGNNTQNKEKQKKLLDFFKTLYYVQHSELDKNKSSLNKSEFSYIRNYISYAYFPPVPPPEIN
jgi:hypothetical protein